MRTTSRALLTSPAFLLALGVLAVNDWVLKPAFGNWMTGKLSDFAGVFALPLLWCAFFPARREAGFLFTGAAFMVWKSPLLDSLLAAWNSVGLWHVSRVVDYTDYVALLSLAPAYRLARRCSTPSLGRPLSMGRRIATLTSALTGVFILAADSVASPGYPLPDTAPYSITATRSDVENGLRALGFEISDPSARQVRDTRVDTLGLYIRQPPERDVHITIEVKEGAPAEVSLTLIAARAFGPPPNTSSLVQAFEKQVIAPLRSWVASHGSATR